MDCEKELTLILNANSDELHDFLVITDEDVINYLSEWLDLLL